jgi:endonuclease YncB( thermonuclease family)
VTGLSRSTRPADPLSAAEGRDLANSSRKRVPHASPRMDRAGSTGTGETLGTLTFNGKDVAAVMIGEGLARPYYGERRQGWCQ